MKRLDYWLLALYIGVMIQWHAHYLKDAVSFWFDFLPTMLLAITITWRALTKRTLILNKK